MSKLRACYKLLRLEDVKLKEMVSAALLYRVEGKFVYEIELGALWFTL